MDNKKTHTWLTGLLTGWGVKESWAKILAGAVLGALCAAGVLTLDGCTASYSQTAEGDIAYTARVFPVDGCRK